MLVGMFLYFLKCSIMKTLDNLQDLEQFKNLEFIARHVVEGFITGLHKSPFHGFSVEFAEHRLYNKGESTKHIDWKLYARTERLFVKRYEEETNLRCQILIDTSSSMYFPYRSKGQNKLAFSVYCAAAIIYLLRKQRDAVGLSLFSNELNLHTEARLSAVHARRLFAELDNLLQRDQKLERTTSIADNLHLIAENVHKRSLIIIFSDMLDSKNSEDLFSALQHMRHNKHDIILFHVTDKEKEENFKLKNRPYKLVDMETGETIKLNPNEFKEIYTKRMKTYNENLKLKCGQYMVDFVQADIKSDFKDILIPYLLKRKKLY